MLMCNIADFFNRSCPTQCICYLCNYNCLGSFVNRFFKFIFTVTPAFLLDPFLNFIAFLFYKFDAKHTKIIRANLNFAYAEELTAEQKEQIIKDTYRNYAKFAVNFIKNQNASKEKILEKVEFKNLEIFQNALASASQSAGITGVSHRTWPIFNFF